MAQDFISQFYSCLNLPIQNRLPELARIVDSSSYKDLQVLFPLLISNVFGTSSSNPGWPLRTVTMQNGCEFALLHSFLEPQGPMFRLCYRLLSDPQCKFNLPLQVLPMELQFSLEMGRCTQFYADLFQVDTQSTHLMSLALNPFDYYIFNFALHLLNGNESKFSADNVNTVYFNLVCDYLIHFLPVEPSVPVLPQIPHLIGKGSMAAPLQTANRSFGSPSLLLKPDLLDPSSQHTSSQSDARNEVWRTETVLQVFADLWMSIHDCSNNNIYIFNRNYPLRSTSSDCVRTVRVLVKHVHSYASSYITDPASRSASMRKHARQLICVRGYHFIKHLVETWPLDTSFRTVMELWLSLIQPWRYAGNIALGSLDRVSRRANVHREEPNTRIFDPSYIQFIAENFPTYTCIFEMVLPRFMRLDLTASKNAVMLFRLGKVFSQPNLVSILRDLEQFVRDSSNTGMYSEHESTNYFSNQSHVNNVISSRWGSVAKQSISELNLSPNFQYSPIWSESNQPKLLQILSYIISAKNSADKLFKEQKSRVGQLGGFWSMFNIWSLLDMADEDQLSLEEYSKTSQYLNASVEFFSNVFGITDNTIFSHEAILEDSSMEQSTFENCSIYPHRVTQKLRRNTNIQYMGDPDLMPIASYESTILVRMLYQISNKLNEMYHDEFSKLWHSNNFIGYVSREILQRPREVQTYVNYPSGQNGIVTHQLPPRVSLRKLGSHTLVVWTTIGYLLFNFLGFGGVFYLLFLLFVCISFILTKATCKWIGFVRSGQ